MQRNKVRKILPLASLVHGVASLSVLEALDRVAGEEGLRSEFLIQLHLTDEPTKSGFSLDELPRALEIAAGFRHARPRGFMAMAPLEGAAAAAGPVFAKARAVLEDARRQGLPLDILSIRMSEDLKEAIREGATHVRVGTAIFGARQVPA